MEVEADGSGITVPVGESVLGRMFNVLGEPIDGEGALPAQTPALADTPQSAVFFRTEPGGGNPRDGH